MSQNYSSPRHFIPNSHPEPALPFYHPPKDPHLAFQSPIFPKSPTPHLNPPFPVQPSSKSYALKPQNELIKNANNNSAYLKPPSDSTFSPLITKSPTEMSKSSFHQTKMPEAFQPMTPPQSKFQPLLQPPLQSPLTPPRRQPRLSEPVGFDSHQSPPQEPKSTFVPIKKQQEAKELKEEPPTQHQEVHFYKKHINTPEQAKEEAPKEWLRYSAKPKRPQRAVCLDNFQIVRSLGKGKYGQVFLTREKSSGFIGALKIMEKATLVEEGIVEQFIREVKIQMFLSHPNIVKLFGCFDDEKHIYIILEVAMGGQLFQQLKHNSPIAEGKVAPIMRQLCAAVEELHAQKIIHRDIKPENIVLHEGIVKLCDFGWSVHLGDRLRTTFCGTPLYVCPEILKGDEYDEKIDIWSVGVMMYEMLVGENPFKISKEEELIKIVKEQVTIPSYVFVSREARDFLDKCLQKNPADRVTIKELVNHEFFTKNAEKEKNDKKVAL